jgi:hypothetical protein
MVVLYAARHRLPVPGLARWLLALGILATLAANVAHGWSHGPIGAAVAAWPAASLVGSYELLLWLIRTAAAGPAAREPAEVHQDDPADHPSAELRLVRTPDLDSADDQETPGPPVMCHGPDGHRLARFARASRTSEPDQAGAAPTYHPASTAADHGSAASASDADGASGSSDIDSAAVAAYRASVGEGRPLSERKLAAMFGKTSRRWARSRMAEARQPLVSATVDDR